MPWDGTIMRSWVGMRQLLLGCEITMECRHVEEFPVKISDAVQWRQWPCKACSAAHKAASD